jgi:hypothetical protein
MLNRRDFLQSPSAGALLASPLQRALAQAQAMTHTRLPAAEATPGFDPHVELSLRAEPGTAPMLQGAPTAVWRYSGSVLKGPRTRWAFWMAPATSR